MKALPLLSIFNAYGNFGAPIHIERLDIAELNGFCSNGDSLIPDPHLVIVRSSDPRIDNTPLGLNDETVMMFPGEEAAVEFRDRFTSLFEIPYAAVV